MRTTEETTVTYPNDNSNNNGNPLYERGYTGWIILACVIVAIALGIYLKSGRNNVHTAANNPNRPVATTPTTTGSAISATSAPGERPPNEK
jgi:hypothetical protein